MAVVVLLIKDQIQVFQASHLLVAVVVVNQAPMQMVVLVVLVAVEPFKAVKLQGQVILLLYPLLKEITVALEHTEEVLVAAAVAAQLKQEVKVLNPLVVLVMQEVVVLVVMVHQTILLFQIQPTLVAVEVVVVQAQVEV